MGIVPINQSGLALLVPRWGFFRGGARTKAPAQSCALPKVVTIFEAW